MADKGRDFGVSSYCSRRFGRQFSSYLHKKAMFTEPWGRDITFLIPEPWDSMLNVR